MIQNVMVIRARHARNILDDKRLGTYGAQRSGEFEVQFVDLARRIADTALAETLARITTL